MDTENFIIHIKTEDVYENTADDVEKRSDASSYDKDDNKPLPIGKNKKVIRLINNELWGKIIIEFVALENYSYKLELYKT